jgi:sec-independent protein translocase protein TatB
MFDLGWPELMLIMVVALVVIGPKELPNAIRMVMGVVRKLRSAAREFQSGIDDLARESGLDDMKRDLEDNLDYYDPGEALKRISESDDDMLGLEDDPLAAGNSILDPASKPETVAKHDTLDTAGEGSADVPDNDKPDTGKPDIDKPKAAGDTPS